MILDCATMSNVLPSVLHDRFVLGATINSTDMRTLCFAFHKVGEIQLESGTQNTIL
jgi:hypothetical protein